MKIRFIAGVVMAALVSGIILFLSPVWLKIVVAILSSVAAFECAMMMLPQKFHHIKIFISLITLLLALVLMFLLDNPKIIILSFTLVLLANLLFFMFFYSSTEFLHQKISASIFSTFYCGICFSFLGLFRDLSFGKQWLFLVLGTNFCTDTGAYLSGKFLGRHKLAPRISPNKTIEGFVGGLVFSFLGTLFVKTTFFRQLSWMDLVCIALMIGVIGPLGDLAESLLKRSAGVKDSGKLIPGHGGLLDRVDALMFAAPAVYAYVQFVKL